MSELSFKPVGMMFSIVAQSDGFALTDVGPQWVECGPRHLGWTRTVGFGPDNGC